MTIFWILEKSNVIQSLLNQSVNVWQNNTTRAHSDKFYILVVQVPISNSSNNNLWAQIHALIQAIPDRTECKNRFLRWLFTLRALQFMSLRHNMAI